MRKEEEKNLRARLERLRDPEVLADLSSRSIAGSEISFVLRRVAPMDGLIVRRWPGDEDDLPVPDGAMAVVAVNGPEHCFYK